MKKKDSYYDTLAFSGGGVKGFCFLGAVKYLEEHKKLQTIKRFVGSSVGGMYATLLYIGFTYDDIVECSIHHNGFNYFKDILLIPYNAYAHYGLFGAHEVVNKFHDFFEQKRFSRNLTFKEAYLKTGKELTLCNVPKALGQG